MIPLYTPIKNISAMFDMTLIEEIHQTKNMALSL